MSESQVPGGDMSICVFLWCVYVCVLAGHNLKHSHVKKRVRSAVDKKTKASSDRFMSLTCHIDALMLVS